MKKYFKKVLTFYFCCGKIQELSPKKGEPRPDFCDFFEKNLKKGIDKRVGMWYNSQAVRRMGGESIIEN